jgi:hypothetical protein
MEDKFKIIDEVSRQYRRFNVEETQLKVRLSPLSFPTSHDDEKIVTDLVTHFETSMNALFEFALHNVAGSDTVGMVIHHENYEGQKDKPIGFSFRRKDQLSPEVIWRLFEKVAQSNSRFKVLDPLSITVHYVKTPVGFGWKALKTKGRPLEQLAHLKKSIVIIMPKRIV